MAKSMYVKMISGALILTAAAVGAQEVPEESGCTPFRWAPWPGATDKSAIMVLALVNGKESMEFQLDTGAFRSYVNSNINSVSSRLPTPSMVSSLAIAGVQLSTSNILVNAPDVNNGNTLGLAQLLGTLFVLDLKAATICIYPGKSAPRTVTEKFKWTAGELRHGHMLTPGWIGNKQTPLMLDTGSGYFELYTSKAN
jgi:predicted aspartyl protease